MNKVEELIQKEYLASGLFHYVDSETIKNANGTFRKLTIETDYCMGQTTICFEYIPLGGEWSVSTTHYFKGEYRGAKLGRKALRTQSKILKALADMDKEAEVR